MKAETIKDHPIGFEITTEVIRDHNKKLMKFLFFILGIDLILMFIAMLLDDISIFSIGAGSGITIGLIALWIIEHHPKYSFEITRSEKKLLKASAERIWIENNPHIHILNYPFYKFIRIWRSFWIRRRGANNVS